MKVTIIQKIMKFGFQAKTSRGRINDKPIWYIKISNGNKWGIGEINTIKGLSVDGHVDYSTFEPRVLEILSKIDVTKPIEEQLNNYCSPEYPALKMGLETALYSLLSEDPYHIFGGKWYSGERGIPINGLIWMGNSEFMLQQLTEKVRNGFKCIKIKVGGLDFDDELDVLRYLRSKYYQEELILRLDANGAFTSKNALGKLERLAEFDIHSIEQPLASGDEYWSELIENSPIPIALDEELIGVNGKAAKAQVLALHPHYIILKPSLLGGFHETREWIALAEERNIGWWITSALESNIGLNAIAQFTDHYTLHTHQGLGTGMIYENNLNSPLEIQNEMLIYNRKKLWDEIES